MTTFPETISYAIISRLRAGAGLFLVIILLAPSGMFTHDSISKPSALIQSLPVQSLLKPDGTLNLTTGFKGALDLTGWEGTLDGLRGPIIRRQSSTTREVAERSALAGYSESRVAYPYLPQATGWISLPNHGLNSYVYAMAVVGSDLYVGSLFTQTADGTVTNLYSIARYSAGSWSSLPNDGLNQPVNAFAILGCSLYVGGQFFKNRGQRSNKPDRNC
jgi:hypothetical protein